MARLEGCSRTPLQISPLELITISSCGLHENILFKLAATRNLSNIKILALAYFDDPANLVKIARLFPNLE